MSYFEGLFAHLPPLASISLRPTWKDSLLSFLDRLWCSRNTYSDTDCGGDLETCWSTSGYVVFLGYGIVSWLSRWQHNITLSSTEAEYVGMTEASKQISWIQNLLSEMRFNIKSIPLLVDNQGAMFLASNPAQEGCTKHIEILEHYIHECIQKERSNFSIFLLTSREQISSQWIWLGSILRRTGSHYHSQDIYHE